MKNQDPYKTKFHLDGTVTLWDVYAQQWHRDRWFDDAVLSSLSRDERQDVIKHCRIGDSLYA